MRKDLPAGSVKESNAAKKRHSHEKIQASAAMLLRRDGLKGTSVRKVMAAAGFTGGGFYAHFPSKDTLVKDAFSCAIQQKRRSLARTLAHARGSSFLESFLRAYLTQDHRDNLGESCPYAALLSELPRASARMRARVREDFLHGVESFVQRMGEDGQAGAREKAIMALCLAFGTLAMSRTLAGFPESDELLRIAASASTYWRVGK